jgi:hypothetical protein
VDDNGESMFDKSIGSGLAAFRLFGVLWEVEPMSFSAVLEVFGCRYYDRHLVYKIKICIGWKLNKAMEYKCHTVERIESSKQAKLLISSFVKACNYLTVI